MISNGTDAWNTEVDLLHRWRYRSRVFCQRGCLVTRRQLIESRQRQCSCYFFYCMLRWEDWAKIITLMWPAIPERCNFPLLNALHTLRTRYLELLGKSTFKQKHTTVKYPKFIILIDFYYYFPTERHDSCPLCYSKRQGGNRRIVLQRQTRHHDANRRGTRFVCYQTKFLTKISNITE